MHGLVAAQQILAVYNFFSFVAHSELRWSFAVYAGTCARALNQFPKTLIGLSGKQERKIGQKAPSALFVRMLFVCVCGLCLLSRREMVIIVNARSYCAEKLHMIFKSLPYTWSEVGRQGVCGGNEWIYKCCFGKECEQVQHSSLKFQYPLRFPSIVQLSESLNHYLFYKTHEPKSFGRKNSQFVFYHGSAHNFQSHSNDVLFSVCSVLSLNRLPSTGSMVV